VVAILAVVAAAVGCATSAVDYLDYVYYFHGPEAALDLLDLNEVFPEDRTLAEVERAIALLELGRYEESAAALARAELVLDAVTLGAFVGASNGDSPAWRPEYHERVMVSTLQIADALALQDMESAAAAADRAMSTVAEVESEPCGFNFTRVLAALAYDGAGRYDDGLEALSQTVVIGRGEELVEGLQSRLERGIAGHQPTGLAPPPVDSDRTLVVVLLLGRGPYKEGDKLTISDSETIRWSRYLPRDPQAVTWAALESEEPEISVELTNVEDLAVTSLRHRAERLVASGGVENHSNSGDLRHWSSLPASLQVVTLRFPDELDSVDLVYYSPDGFEVDREIIELPDTWIGGRLFVTRRMP